MAFREWMWWLCYRRAEPLSGGWWFAVLGIRERKPIAQGGGFGGALEAIEWLDWHVVNAARARRCKQAGWIKRVRRLESNVGSFSSRELIGVQRDESGGTVVLFRGDAADDVALALSEPGVS